MLQARPLSGLAERHVYRERLLGMLPDSPGHVVWLHAPLGYGKSILAAQWAESLEADGWRILWTAMLGNTVQTAVAAALRLPPSAPWTLISEEFSLEPTLLVIEDLQGDEELEQLLRIGRQGLILLASRSRLQEPELLKLQTDGRLHEVGAGQLAFTADEAAELGQKLATGDAADSWQETAGWPLLLHFALLTGDAGSAPLHVVLRRSISDAAWQEALFLAAASMIEHSGATAATRELVSAGFLQELQQHYRLHPLLADHLLRSNPAEVRSALEAGLDRLQRMEPVRACKRAGHDALLARELDGLPVHVVVENCEEYLKLSGLVASPEPARRNVRDALARMIMVASPAHADELKQALAASGIPASELAPLRLHAAVMCSRVGYHDRAAELLSTAEADLDAAPSSDSLRLLAAKVLVLGYAGAHTEALETAHLARSVADDLGTNEARSLARNAVLNATPFRFELTGDAAAEAQVLTELAADPGLSPERRSPLHFNLAVNLIFELENERALEVARLSSRHGEPFWRLWADVLIAYQTGDLAAFPDLFRQAGTWETNSTLGRVAALWLRLCRKEGDLDTPQRLAGKLPPDPFVKLELALHSLALGQGEEARRLLAEAAGGYPNREFRQHWHTASFLITGDEAELDALLELSVSPTKLVRYVLLPLATLPRNRPELVKEYPLQEVLESGWKEAVEYRHAEIPRLEVSLLGGFRVRHFGRELQLSNRQQQILTLLALGFSKEGVAAEVWPEASSDNTNNNLNVQMHMLRRILEPWGLPTFLIDGALSNADVDLDALRLALDHNDTGAVLKLYRGDLVPELDTPSLMAERESLKHTVLNHLIAAATTAKPVDALPLLERVMELDQLNEQAISLLASQLLRLGRRNSARKRISEFSERLEVETGLRPAGELLALLKD